MQRPNVEIKTSFSCVYSVQSSRFITEIVQKESGTKTNTATKSKKNAIQLSGKKDSSHSDINDSIAIGITLVSHGFVSFYPRYISNGMVWFSLVGALIWM